MSAFVVGSVYALFIIHLLVVYLCASFSLLLINHSLVYACSSDVYTHCNWQILSHTTGKYSHISLRQ